MKNTMKRIEGAAEQAGGAIEKGVGKLIGNERLVAEGRRSELEGKAKRVAAKAAEQVKGAVQEAGGAVKNAAGKVLDDDKMAAEGKAKELEGKARQKLSH